MVPDSCFEGSSPYGRATETIVRIWRTGVDRSRMKEYEEFEREESKPMFRKQAGNLGVLFVRSQAGCAAISFWIDSRSVERLARSKTYQQTVKKLKATGLLKGRQDAEVFEVEGGFLSPDALLKD